MPAKLTVEKFISRSNITHGYKYDYSSVIYTNNSTKVRIFCSSHGEFSQRPANHMKGDGCPVCGSISTGVKSRQTPQEFAERAREIHNNKYEYSKSVYTRNIDCIIITCSKHKTDFSQKPADHLAGKGCPVCSTEKVNEIAAKRKVSYEEFVRRARSVHGDKYNYNNVSYNLLTNKVSIWCQEHSNFFLQTPRSHLVGSGCPDCTKYGYSISDSAYLYLLKCGDITKIGITNSSPKDRACKVSKSYGAEFQIIWNQLFQDGKLVSDIETTLIRYLKKLYKQPKAKFEGRSECFLNVDLTDLLRQIESLISETV